MWIGRGRLKYVRIYVVRAYFVASIESVFLMHHFRAYPYALHKHNILDGFGHGALVLTYMVTLILRHNENNTAVWANEWFPKAGYGCASDISQVVLRPHLYTVVLIAIGTSSSSST